MQTTTTSRTIKKTRNNAIQWFRAIAIIAVIIAHTCPSGLWVVTCRPFLNYCVPLFIFISGYLTKVDNNDWGGFFKKRIIRVMIPYIIWTIIYTIESRNLAKLPVNLLTSGAAAHLYFILVYVQFVLLTPVLGKLARSKYHYLGWFVAPIILLFYKYLPLINGHGLNGYVYTVCWNLCLGWFTFYYLGLMLGNKIIEKKFSWKVLIPLYVACIIIEMGEGYYWLQSDFSNPGGILKISGLATSAVFLLMVYTILQKGGFEVKSKFMLMVGEYSFGIYLSHVLVLHLLKLTPFYPSLPFLVNSVLVLLISLGLCYLGDKVLGTRISRWIGFK